MAAATAGVFYEDALAGARHPARKKSLELIKAACDSLEKKKIRISVVLIAEYCEGKLKAQSIYNSDVLTRYAELRQFEQKLPKALSGEVREPFISDVEVRAFVELLKGEVQSLGRENSRLKKAVEGIAPLSVAAILGKEGAAANRPPARDAALVAALRKLTNTDLLSEFGLEISKNRLRSSATYQVLYEPADLAAIRSYLDETQQPTP